MRDCLSCDWHSICPKALHSINISSVPWSHPTVGSRPGIRLKIPIGFSSTLLPGELKIYRGGHLILRSSIATEGLSLPREIFCFIPNHLDRRLSVFSRLSYPTVCARVNVSILRSTSSSFFFMNSLHLLHLLVLLTILPFHHIHHTKAITLISSFSTNKEKMRASFFD